MKKIWAIGLILLAVVIFISFRKPAGQLDSPASRQPGSEAAGQPESTEPQIIATKLEIPWELAFLPNGEMLVTERAGRLLVIGDEKKNYEVKEVTHIGEGGLLGLSLDPSFASNNFIYLYFTYRSDGKVLNKVVKFKFKNDNLSEEQVIVDRIPGSTNHDGGRIKFGPDGKLYITTGDAQNTDSTQNLKSLSGKILRLNSDGSVPGDNPFQGSPVYSYGHRNSQGLAWDANGNLWATEHGPSTKDEVNLIKKGSNYGWPTITGDQSKEGMETPIINSGGDTWAPSGAVIADSKLYFAGLRGEALYSMDLRTRELKEYFKGEFGRIRSVSLGPDGAFYLITSNRDERNPTPDVSDDRIIRVSSEIF